MLEEEYEVAHFRRGMVRADSRWDGHMQTKAWWARAQSRQKIRQFILLIFCVHSSMDTLVILASLREAILYLHLPGHTDSAAQLVVVVVKVVVMMRGGRGTS